MKERTVEMTISVSRTATKNTRYLLSDFSRVENLFLVIFELREILV